jgi:hypothetical protein
VEISSVNSGVTYRSSASTETDVSALSASGTTGSTEAAAYSGLAAFPTPRVQFDPAAGVSVTLFRDASTGAATGQIPSLQVVREYERNGGESGSELAAKPAAEPVDGTATATATPTPTPTPETGNINQTAGQLVSLGV